MGKVMTRKNCNFVLTLFCIFVGVVWISPLAAYSQKSSTSLPVLRYAGVIPVQWAKEEVWHDLDHIKKDIDSEFSNAIRSSKRFSVINDDLIKTLWKTPAGRKELETDYELNAFANLDVTARGDMVVLTTRLLSPKLETRLQESDVIPRKWLGEATREQTSARLVDLVQRLINRLPVDAHITSVNGNFVTISGGSEQGVKVGDKFDVLAANVQNLHPANGSWISFATNKTGAVEVIEIKNMTSIAKITSLTFDGSIKPGNGIRIEDISGRSRFARAEESSAMPSASTQESAIAAPLGADGKPIPTPKPPEPKIATPAADKKPAVAATATQAKPDGQATDPAQAATTEGQPQAAGTAESTDPIPPTDNFTARLMPKGSEMRTWFGLKMWSISGSASAAASLPVWLINSGGADIYRKFSDTIDYNYGLDLGYGPTAKGNFFGYNLHSAARWHLNQKDILPGADDVYFGAQVSMASASINGETSGGYDLTQIRLTIGVHGWAKPAFIGDKVEWTGEFFYPLYYSGRFGVKKAFKNIDSGSSLAFRVGGYVGERPPSGWQYGAAIDYESSAWSLANKKTANYDSFGILGLARRTL